LKRQVKRKIKEEMEEMFRPTQVKRITVKKKVRQTGRRAKVSRPLDGVFPGGKVIYATYKSKDYKAWVNRNGRIRVRLGHNRKLFDTPSGAGSAVRGGKTTNGWSFWKVKNGKGELVALGSVRSK